jgi:hypothetical protein
MYAVVYSADVRGDYWTYTLQIVQRTYVGPLNILYFLGDPLGNTWTYETSYRTSAGVTGRPLLYQRVGGELSL